MSAVNRSSFWLAIGLFVIIAGLIGLDSVVSKKISTITDASPTGMNDGFKKAEGPSVVYTQRKQIVIDPLDDPLAPAVAVKKTEPALKQAAPKTFAPKEPKPVYEIPQEKGVVLVQ